MTATASRIFSYVIVGISLFLSMWGLLGFLEYFWGYAPLLPLQNPEFPQGTQFLHWLAISVSGLVFLAGYGTHWAYTPHAMVVIYAVMATLCFVQTFDFMTNPSRYLAMVVEYVAYLAIGIFLFRSRRMQQRFGRD
jgi:uncharacterized membrane protein YccC